MLPNWLTTTEAYEPPKGGGTFAIKTMRSFGHMMGRLQFQQGHEKRHALPALVKFFLLVLAIVFLSRTHQLLALLAYAAVLLLYLSTWPPRDIWKVLRGALVAVVFSGILLAPAMILRPEGIGNNLQLICKVFLTVMMVSIFNHTTQWNHITGALRKLHVPGVVIFTLDLTLKYIVILGRFIYDVLTSYSLRAVGNHKKKYKSVGGVMGITFIRGAHMSQEMYEAMRCRGFTDDYRGL